MLTANEISKAKNIKLSDNFTLFELIRSDSRPNLMQWPNDDILDKLKFFAENVLQPIRDEFGPIRINSGYRNPELNRAVGGVSNSIHQIYVNNKFTGVAADIYPSNERDLVKVMAFIAKKVPEAKRVIIYRKTRELGINSPFLHVDSDVKVSFASRPVLMEKANRSAYVSFNTDELEKYFY